MTLPAVSYQGNTVNSVEPVEIPSRSPGQLENPGEDKRIQSSSEAVACPVDNTCDESALKIVRIAGVPRSTPRPPLRGGKRYGPCSCFDSCVVMSACAVTTGLCLCPWRNIRQASRCAGRTLESGHSGLIRRSVPRKAGGSSSDAEAAPGASKPCSLSWFSFGTFPLRSP